MNGKEAYVALAEGKKLKTRFWDVMGMNGCYIYMNSDGIVWYNILGHEAVYMFNLYDEYLPYEEENDGVLDKEEKEYLSSIIKPFRKRVKSITKNTILGDCQYSYISIEVENNEPIELPIFHTDDMYINMMLNHHYKVNELGL